MKKPEEEKKFVETLPGTNAVGVPLHPVCCDGNARTHIVTTVGRAYLTCVTLPLKSGPVHLVKIDAFKHGLKELELRKNDKVELYPIKRAIRMFLKFAKEKGITDGARDALEALKAEHKELEGEVT